MGNGSLSVFDGEKKGRLCGCGAAGVLSSPLLLFFSVNVVFHLCSEMVFMLARGFGTSLRCSVRINFFLTDLTTSLCAQHDTFHSFIQCLLGIPTYSFSSPDLHLTTSPSTSPKHTPTLQKKTCPTVTVNMTTSVLDLCVVLMALVLLVIACVTRKAFIRPLIDVCVFAWFNTETLIKEWQTDRLCEE